MSYCPASPPAYGVPESTSETEPLLIRGSISDRPDTTDSDVPDDFKYGTTVSDSAPQIRNAFIRKVYTILLSQILATVVVAGALSQSTSTLGWVKNHIWAFFIAVVGAMINLFTLHHKRHAHPWNFVLLLTFTVAEAFALGIAVAFYENRVLLQALLITLVIFIGLTLFTFQTRYDFSGWGPYLLSALIVLITTSIVHMLVTPFSRTTDIVYTVTGCFVFSAFVVYDTYCINTRLSPDEFIMGVLSLYLDFLNIFLRIVRHR